MMGLIKFEGWMRREGGVQLVDHKTNRSVIRD